MFLLILLQLEKDDKILEHRKYDIKKRQFQHGEENFENRYSIIIFLATFEILEINKYYIELNDHKTTTQFSLNPSACYHAYFTDKRCVEL